MGRQIHVDLERTIAAPPARVHAALADYAGRPRILPGSYLDYRVEEGGAGDGTVVSYRLRAARRERRYELEVSEPTPGVTLVERDRNSSLITTWILNPADGGTATNLKLSTIWEGSGGVAGRHGVPVAAVAVAWVNAQPGVTGAIVGARRPSQVDGWIAAGDLELTEADLAEIDQAIRETGAG